MGAEDSTSAIARAKQLTSRAYASNVCSYRVLLLVCTSGTVCCSDSKDAGLEMDCPAIRPSRERHAGRLEQTKAGVVIM